MADVDFDSFDLDQLDFDSAAQVNAEKLAAADAQAAQDALMALDDDGCAGGACKI